MIEIYGTADCSFVQKIINLCERNNLEYEYRSVSIEDNLVFLYERGISNLPQVFKDGDHIGGFEDLVSYIDVVVCIETERDKRNG